MRMPNKPVFRILLAAVLILLFAKGVLSVNQFYQKNNHKTQDSAYIFLKSNTTLNQLCQQLHQLHWISQPKLFSLWLRATGMADIQAGLYQLQPAMSPIDLVKQMNRGQVAQLPFAVIAGQTWRTIEQHMHQAPWLKDDIDVTDLANTSPQGELEGSLLADTYYYTADSSATRLIERAQAHLKKTLDTYWQNRQADLPFDSPYQLLIAASIIEKETAVEQERADIAQVIVNRLRKSMRLQMDPTVIYALRQSYTGVITKQNLQVQSPYNTYVNRGLPPTPIAMVSEASIKAAAQPTQGNYLYFVAKGDGTHLFSSTYAQHAQAVKRFIQGTNK